MNLTRVKGQKKAKIGRDNPDDDGNGGSSGGSYAGGGSSAGGGDIVGESSSTGGENHKTSGDGSGTSSSWDICIILEGIAETISNLPFIS